MSGARSNWGGGNSSLLEPLRPEARQLDSRIRSDMERTLGAPFGDVVVHTGSASAQSADAFDAAAFTVGRHIVFNQGRYDPGSARGQMLLAHELTHVVQQRRGGGDLDAGERMPSSELSVQSGHSEAQAHEMGGSAFSPGGTVSGAAGVGIARQTKVAEKAAPAPAVPMFEYTDETGTVRRVTVQEAENLRVQAVQRMRSALTRVESLAENWRSIHKDHLDMGHAESWGELWDKPSRIWGVAANMRAGVVPPTLGIWHHPVHVAQEARKALDAGNLVEAARMLRLATTHLDSARKQWNEFLDASIGGADKLVGELEVVRDTSFAIAIAAGAIVAAPVVAAGVAATGATGGTALVLTAAGTGLTTAGGGAVLRGTADAAGQKVATGKVDAGKTWKHVRSHLKEDLVTGLTAGLAPGAGQAAGLGKQGLGLGQTITRNVAVQSGVSATTGVTSTAADTALALAEGKTWEEAKEQNLLPGLKSTLVSTATSAVTAPLGSFGQAVAKGKPLLGKAIEHGGDAAVTAGSTLAMGGTLAEARSNVLNSIVSSAALGKGRSGSDKAAAAKKRKDAPAPPAAKPPAQPDTPDLQTGAGQPKEGQTKAPKPPAAQSAPSIPTPDGPSIRPSDTKRKASAGERMRQRAEGRHKASAQAEQEATQRVAGAEKRLADAQAAVDSRPAGGKKPTKAQQKELAVARNELARANSAHARARSEAEKAKLRLDEATQRAEARNAAYEKAKAAATVKGAKSSTASGEKKLKRIWRSARKKAWKQWAAEEIAARKAGTSQAPLDMATQDALLEQMAAAPTPVDDKGHVDWGKTTPGARLPGAEQELNPIKALTDVELAEVARTGKVPDHLGAEIEHARIPQRVGRWLAAAGLPPKEAASLSKLGDIDNLEPASKKWHGTVDEMAARRRKGHDRTDPMSSLDIRAGRPLANASAQELGQIVEALKKPGVDLDRKFDVDGKKMSWREILQAEKIRRESTWEVP